MRCPSHRVVGPSVMGWAGPHRRSYGGEPDSNSPKHDLTPISALAATLAAPDSSDPPPASPASPTAGAAQPWVA